MIYFHHVIRAGNLRMMKLMGSVLVVRDVIKVREFYIEVREVLFEKAD
jgi:hypothetical protein